MVSVRSSERPWALGADLADFQSKEELALEDLAALLGCEVETLHWLALCWAPGDDRF